MSERKWVPPPPPRRRLSAWLSAWLGPTLVIAGALFIVGLAAYPYLPPVRAERERVVAIARAELDQLAPPGEAASVGTYTSIDLGRGPGVRREYGSVLPCQEVHTYYASVLASAGWSQLKAPYEVSDSQLIATYGKQTQDITLKLIVGCYLNGAGFNIRIIQPDFWNNGD